jgi:DNA-binding transcriptional MerR regulator
MATAGAAVGAIMAISPVFAQGTSTTPTDNSTLLSDILAAAQKANLTAEQIKELLEVASEFTTQTTTTQTTTKEAEVDEDVDEEDDDTADVAAAAATTKEQEKKHTVTITFTAPKSSEEKGGDD